MRSITCILALALSTTTASAGESWPQFRGPAGDGHSDATGLPLNWSETENVTWKTPIHDRGWSSPVIWEDQVWLTTATADGHRLYAVCVDARTGKIVHDVKVFDVEEPERIARVNAIGERMRSEYRKLGFNVLNSQTPIIPILIGDDIPTVLAWKTLYEAGVYTNPVLPPAVSPESSLLRTSYMATHTDEQLDRVAGAFAGLAQMLGIGGKAG